MENKELLKEINKVFFEYLISQTELMVQFTNDEEYEKAAKVRNHINNATNEMIGLFIKYTDKTNVEIKKTFNGIKDEIYTLYLTK